MSTNVERPESTLLDLGTVDAGACRKQISRAGAPNWIHEIGAIYEPAFLKYDESRFLLEMVDDKPWANELKRRVQHYGWKYDYSSRFVTEGMKAEPLPYFIRTAAEMLMDRGWFERVPDQVIVNEYKPDQGIAPHVDRDCFGPTVATLSLGDCWPMQFARARRDDRRTNRMELDLAVGSILILQGDARSKWMHGIAKRKYNGRGLDRRERRRRVSVTFRTVEC